MIWLPILFHSVHDTFHAYFISHRHLRFRNRRLECVARDCAPAAARGHNLLRRSIHIPYGPRSLQEIRSFSEAITRFLLDHGCKIIVVACNAASAAALKHLRATFPAVPVVGMEPAVKPAAETTRTGVVGVLATPATFQSELFASVVERFANGVQLVQEVCPGLVQQIEAGRLTTPDTLEMLDRF
jgi:glutamate racemase